MTKGNLDQRTVCGVAWSVVWSGFGRSFGRIVWSVFVRSFGRSLCGLVGRWSVFVRPLVRHLCGLSGTIRPVWSVRLVGGQISLWSGKSSFGRCPPRWGHSDQTLTKRIACRNPLDELVRSFGRTSKHYIFPLCALGELCVCLF